MRLLHPFMPFVTEEIWQQLPHEGESITVAPWPQVRPELSNHEAAEQMRLLVDIIRAVRNIRAEVNTPLSKPITLHIKAKDEQIASTLQKNRSYIERFCNPSELVIDTTIPTVEKAMTAVVTGAELSLPLEGLINIEEEVKRLEKELQKLDQEVERVQKKLSNEGFLAKAPAHVVEEERKKERDYIEKREAVRARLAQLKQ